MKFTIEFSDGTKRAYETTLQPLRQGLVIIELMHPEDAEFCHIRVTGGHTVKGK